MLRNPFESRGKKDIRERTEIQQESNDRYNSAIAKARACLDHPLFQTYKAECEDAIVELFEAWLSLTPDENYAIRSVVIAEKIKALRSLGVGVSNVAALTPRQVAKPKEKELLKT